MGLSVIGLGLPATAKCKILSPLTGLVADNYLDRRIAENVRQLKRENPSLKIGETHCHSTFSDGTYDIKSLMHRAATLGLDYIVVTEHLIPDMFPLENSLLSFQERWNCFNCWDLPGVNPITVYPAFEISTEQGHLILIFPADYLIPKKYDDVRKLFSKFDNEYPMVDVPARLVRKLGGISIIPHPNRTRFWYPFGVSTDFVKEHLVGLVDAIEDISTGHGYDENYSEELGLASIGSSDDHFNLIIGTTVTGYDSKHYNDLLSAVKNRGTRAIKVEHSLSEILTTMRQII